MAPDVPLSEAQARFKAAFRKKDQIRVSERRGVAAGAKGVELPALLHSATGPAGGAYGLAALIAGNATRGSAGSAGSTRPSRSGDVGALFGAARCFTPDPAKAQGYARGVRRFGGVVIVARVVLGDVADVGRGSGAIKTLRRPPPLAADPAKDHHSVLGDNGQAGAVVCVYRHARAYPELLLYLR